MAGEIQPNGVFYEQRLQQVERDSAEHGATIAGIAESVSSLKGGLADTRQEFREGFRSLKSEVGGKIDQLLQLHPAMNARVEKLEAGANRREARISALKKAGWALVIAIVGAFAKGFVDYVSKR